MDKSRSTSVATSRRPTHYDMLDTDDGRQALDEAVVDYPPTSNITAPLLKDLSKAARVTV
ncbi:hypothetical protein BGX30_002985 [Mortierella sp. GBA39]|nr:hypothetical protein BGX30_002985 [Mortierella sp. GBA39]